METNTKKTDPILFLLVLMFLPLSILFISSAIWNIDQSAISSGSVISKKYVPRAVVEKNVNVLVEDVFVPFKSTEIISASWRIKIQATIEGEKRIRVLRVSERVYNETSIGDIYFVQNGDVSGEDF